jgi:hypothetical protein
MRAIQQTKSPSPLAKVFLGAILVASFPSAAHAAGDLAATRSGNDLMLSFPTAGPDLYILQTSSDLLQPWTNFHSGAPGDGTVKQVTITNGISAGKGFYRLLIQRPVDPLLPQSIAFAILGHWCGGIHEQAYIIGFDPTSGYPIGEVHLSTTCSTGGRGSPPATFTAWAAVSWNFAGNVISSTALSNAPTFNPTFTATDAYGDVIYNAGALAYLVVPVAAAPASVTAVQSGDQFQVSWRPNGVNPTAVASTTVTATPVNSTAPILTTTVAGSATTAIIASLQPQTTYQITVVNTTIGGPSPGSMPLRVTTVAASVPPSAPPGLTPGWMNLNPTGTTDTLVASWQAAVPGDSPIDQYQVMITGSDGAGTFMQTLPATTLTAQFAVDYIPDWSVTVQAHNAVGWGPWSSVFALGGL